MTLDVVRDSLTDLDEALQKLYVEKDGKFYLDMDETQLTEHSFAKGLVTNRDKILTELREARAQHAKYVELGLSVEQIQELAKQKDAASVAAAKAADDAATKDGNWEAVKESLVSKHNEEVAALEGKLTGANVMIDRLVIDRAAKDAIVTEKGEPVLLMAEVKRQLRRTDAVDQEGLPILEVYDPVTNTPQYADGGATPQTVMGIVQGLRADKRFARAFEGSNSTGSGSQSSDKTINVDGVKTLSDLKTVAQKSAYVDKNGQEKFQELVTADALSKAATT